MGVLVCMFMHMPVRMVMAMPLFCLVFVTVFVHMFGMFVMMFVRHVFLGMLSVRGNQANMFKIRSAQQAAPKPLSILKTDMPEEQLASMAQRAVSPFFAMP